MAAPAEWADAAAKTKAKTIPATHPNNKRSSFQGPERSAQRSLGGAGVPREVSGMDCTFATTDRYPVVGRFNHH